MNKILYISGLNKKKRKYDGERIKNTLIYNSLTKKYDVKLINLSRFKLIRTFSIFFQGLFFKKKYDYIVISKDPHGANIIHRILKMARFPFDKIIYFEIGPFLYDRILNGSIKKETFISDKLIVVETNSMKQELESLSFKNIDVFPNFKPIVNVGLLYKNYPVKCINLVFLSRIEEKKGLYDLIDVLTVINSNFVKYKLDIYGRIQSSGDRITLNYYLKKYNFISYKGKMDVGSVESYKILSSYDLHVFPTKYTEGFPGSLIDFFIAGVPTLSSSFARAHEILTDNDSIFFEQGSNNDLLKKLEFIYNNQNILSSLRENSYKKRELYSTKHFEDYLDKII